MPPHDQYGKDLLGRVMGEAFMSSGPTVQVDFGFGSPGRIDGTIGAEVAVEIESRVSKQIRGAIMDLILHPYPKKLLVLLPVHMQNAESAAEQCRAILARFLPIQDFRVALLVGDGYRHMFEADEELLRLAIADLSVGAAYR